MIMNERYKLIGHDKTYFTLTIDSFDGNSFQGTVKDDIESGGMEEVGRPFFSCKNEDREHFWFVV